ncbi:unnamed protein product [Adineta steineri]|uniref:Uncharacterized protein n=1 Tax=Adineta steineri TaxID=433720 RepID=A0A818YBU2_9BILA|nr:unnamed protein product [Adineta steineri]CAF3750602.1 unnamed protein product [Adineta steineri]
MKTGLFIALLVLVASINVFGQSLNEKTDERKDRLDTTLTGEKVRPGTIIREENKTTTFRREEIKPETIIRDDTKSDTLRTDETVTVEIPRDENIKPEALRRDENIKSEALRRDENIKPEALRRVSSTKTETVRTEETKPISVVPVETTPVAITRDENVKPEALRRVEKTKTETVRTEETKPAPVVPVEITSTTTPRDENVNADTLQRDDIESNKVLRRKKVTKVSEVREEESSHDGDKEREPEERVTPGAEKERESEEDVKSDTEKDDDETSEHKEVADKERVDSNEADSKFVKTEDVEPKVDVTVTKHETIRKTGLKLSTGDVARVSEKSIHVSGNILLIKYRPAAVDSVQYDLDGARLIHGSRPLVESRLPFARDYLAKGSHVMLYVSTLKTTDPKLAFAKFPVEYKVDNFPLTFDIDIDLPDQQLGLLERSDITLYFFVYITNVYQRMDTFLPAGTSQILLQGTNRLVQKLDVYVRPSGIEITGLFRGRFGEKYIQSGTTFQILIVSEKTLLDKNFSSKDAVAQLTITDVPAMFPIPFSFLVNHQMLESGMKYYAVPYTIESGVRRMITLKPVWVINEQKVLITSQLIFTVIPYPFIIKGFVSRAMPSTFYIQPNSVLKIHFHELGTPIEDDIVFKLPEIVTLPQVFQVNISQAISFDPSKKYEVRAVLYDETNEAYMATLQPIPLLDEFSRLSIPVDDLLYYSRVRLHASSNQLLSYMPGSSAQIFVTESPETPTKPIVAMRVDKIDVDFHDFLIKVPATAIEHGRNYYLVMMIEVHGIITHVSKSLFISNNQPPPLVIQLPVLSLNLVRGVIFDVDNRPAQWSSSSYATLYLLDDTITDMEKAVVQTFKIHLENDFPVRFEVQLDFGRLHADRVYRLQTAIENGRGLLEYKPAGSVLILNPQSGLVTDIRIPVRNFKTFQVVNGLVYINDFTAALPEKSEIIVQLSSSPLLSNPSIIDEIRIKVEGHTLPVNFTMNLPLNKIDINAVYYFLVRYTVRDVVVIPASQVFAFSPRNEATIVLTLSKTPQIPITGQVTSTGSALILPTDSTLHLYITDDVSHEKPLIYSEVFLQASTNSIYEFTMNIDSIILQSKKPLYLQADIIYHDAIILSMPRRALLQITPGGEWNINLIVDLPTLLIGKIVTMNSDETVEGDFDVHVEILDRTTTKVVHTTKIRFDIKGSRDFRIELDTELFVHYSSLSVRAVVKNCKNQVLYESGGAVNIHTGLNLNVDLSVVLTDRKKITELSVSSYKGAPLAIGSWQLSVTGVVSDTKTVELNKRIAN